MTRVLVAFDLEAEDASANHAVLQRAAYLASVQAARLLVLYVIDDRLPLQAASHLQVDGAGLQDRLRRQARTAIESLLIASGRTRHTDVHVEFGSPHEVISRLARERQAGLVVIGPGRPRRLKDRILGSTADRVIRTCAAPILLVRKPSVQPYRGVAVALDTSAAAAPVLAQASRLAPEASIQLVHALDIGVAFQRALLRAGISPVEMQRYRAALARQAHDELVALQREVLDTTKLPIRIIAGEAGPALVRLSRSPRIDLLVLGSRRHGAALQVLLGSVARQVLAAAACDVLVAAAQQ